MAITQDRDIAPDGAIPLRHITLSRAAVAASQTALLIGSVKPGYAFEIVGVQHLVGTVTGTASYQVKIGTVAATTATTPVAATRGDATLSTTVQGTATSVINLHATTASGAALAEAGVIITLRPLGLRGDAR